MSEWKGSRYWANRPIEERIKNLKIPKRYERLTLDNYDKAVGDTDVHYAVSTWLKMANQHLLDGMGLYLFGGTGVGKTHLAIALLKQTVTDNQCSGFFIPVTNYMEMMYDELNNDGELPEEYSSSYLAKYIRSVYDLVVLDGLGDENDTEFTRRSISTLINQRVNAKLPTIVTSLYNPKKLTLRYGERFVSILQSVCRLVPVAGTDQRNAGK